MKQLIGWIIGLDFGANKRSIEVIKEGTFGGTYFRDIYSGVTGRWYLKSWKDFDPLEKYWSKVFSSDYYDASVNKYSVKCGALLRFWENKGWINEIDPYGWFQWYLRYWLSRRSEDDERKINRWIKIVGRFRGKLVKMIEGAGSKFDDYSISPKIRQILLHSGLWINWVITSLTDKESYKKQKKIF